MSSQFPRLILVWGSRGLQRLLFSGKNGIKKDVFLKRFLDDGSLQERSPEEDPMALHGISFLQGYFSKKALSQSPELEKCTLNLPGTLFQKKVWQGMKHIPFGHTASYGDLARLIGFPKACRAVGRAASSNPLPIFIPCHRIIGGDGALVGFASGLEIKKRLLAHEGIWSC